MIADNNSPGKSELKEFLDEKYDLYNRPSFVDTDPIQIPHRYTQKEDVEIAAFLTATIAWGKRNMIIKNATKLMDLLGDSPYSFVREANDKQISRLQDFKHRTFNGIDLQFFISSLRYIYDLHGGLGSLFCSEYSKHQSIKEALIHFSDVFFSISHPSRSRKHVSNVAKNSAAKRLNMFLMWMVRNDNRGVHFGLWNSIPTSALFLPLDVHTSNISRKLGLLSRKQNDWKAVTEITQQLQKFDAHDPVKYDFALFGLGVFEKF